MSDTAVAPAPQAAIAPAPSPAAAPTSVPAPWFQGKIDGELLGHMQTLGWHTKSAEDAAVEAIKAHREARSYIGMPETRLIKLPADPVKEPDAMRDVFQRLGAPKEAKDYDFTAVKFSDGKTPDPTFDAAIRNASFEANLPKDAATHVAQAVVKYLDDADKAEAAEMTARNATEAAELKKNWGQNWEANLFVAKQAAAKLGIEPSVVDTLQNLDKVGYAKVMDAFRQLGVMMGEGRYIAGTNPAGNGIMTAEQAKSRLSELEGDKAFGKRLDSGDPAAIREWKGVLTVLHGEAAA
jgi:hypothetical protein